MSRAPPLLLALVATSCSLLFPVEPYATGTDGGTGSAGGAAGNAASFLLVARDSRDTFIATFADGALTGVERGPGLSAAGSGIGRLDGEALAINDELRADLIAGTSLTDIERHASEAKQFVSFRQCASFLMSRKLISASEALMAISR